MGGVRKAGISGWEKERREREANHSQATKKFAEEKVCLHLTYSGDCYKSSVCVVQENHERCLEPGLGHPGASQQLSQLTAGEETRHTHCLDHISSHSMEMKVKKHFL